MNSKDIIYDGRKLNVTNEGVVSIMDNPWIRDIIRPKCNQDGYFYVEFQGRLSKKTKRVFLHHLVGKLFVPNPDGKPKIKHKDKINNNHYTNLIWVD